MQDCQDRDAARCLNFSRCIWAWGASMPSSVMGRSWSERISWNKRWLHSPPCKKASTSADKSDVGPKNSSDIRWRSSGFVAKYWARAAAMTSRSHARANKKGKLSKKPNLRRSIAAAHRNAHALSFLKDCGNTIVEHMSPSAALSAKRLHSTHKSAKRPCASTILRPCIGQAIGSPAFRASSRQAHPDAHVRPACKRRLTSWTMRSLCQKSSSEIAPSTALITVPNLAAENTETSHTWRKQDETGTNHAKTKPKVPHRQCAKFGGVRRSKPSSKSAWRAMSATTER